MGDRLAAAGLGARDLLLGRPARESGSPDVLRRRLVALLIDGLVGAALVLLILREFGFSWRTPAATALVALAVAIAYLVVAQGRLGATLGKLALGLRVMRDDGGPPGYRAAALRGVALALDGTAVVALVSMLRSPRRERLGDRWAGTHVVSDPGALRRVRGRLSSAWRAALTEATTRPARVLGIAVALALLGVLLDTQTKVVSDVPKLVPQSQALRDVDTLQRVSGVSGEIDVTVEADDLTDPKVVKWMTDYQNSLLKHYGYSPTKGCGRAKLCPALSLPDLFRSSGAASDRQRVRTLLDAVPAYFSQAVITRDRRVATLAFGIRLMPFDQQQDVIEEMRRRLDPPGGVRASLAGLPVIAAEANAAVSSPWRCLLTLTVGLLAVALVLLAVFRQVERALIPLVPIALATGWSALILFLLRIPLNPMSVTLGALVIAISTEFSVLLSERYRQERAAGLEPPAALAHTYRRTGAAVLASGATAIAGFAVLILSDVRMLRDFGFVTVVDLTVSLIGVMVVLPAVLVLAERGELLDLPAAAWERARHALPRRRRARAA